MGLDMYLTKKYYCDENLRSRIKVPGIKSDKISHIEVDVCYWRKANAIHQWFVDNVQDGDDNCQSYYVEPDKLKNLLDTVKKVLKDHALAEQLLPTQEGFFFGETDYDQYYYQELEYTEQELTKELVATKLKNDLMGDYYYQASW